MRLYLERTSNFSVFISEANRDVEFHFVAALTSNRVSHCYCCCCCCFCAQRPVVVDRATWPAPPATSDRASGTSSAIELAIPFPRPSRSTSPVSIEDDSATATRKRRQLADSLTRLLRIKRFASDNSGPSSKSSWLDCN